MKKATKLQGLPKRQVRTHYCGARLVQYENYATVIQYNLLVLALYRCEGMI